MAWGCSEGVWVDASSYPDIQGKTGALERFTAATIIVDGKGYNLGFGDLVPPDDPKELGIL